MKFTLTIFISFILGIQLYAGKPEKTTYREIYRPQFHFSPEKHVLENICGLVYLDNEYHMFYHYHKFNTPEQKKIGHAISPDLVHWQHIPFELFNDTSSFMIQGGSVVVDSANKLEMQEGNTPTMLFFYSDKESEINIAFSNDKGRSWSSYSKALSFNSEINAAKNPNIFYHKATNEYVMMIHRVPENNHDKEGISIFNSNNLINWEFKSHIIGFNDQVDLVELNINRRPDDSKWVLFDTDGTYLIGIFDGKKFIPENEKLSGDLSRNFWSPKTFKNLPDDDNRVIQMAVLKDGEYNGMNFNGQTTFPCEISLRKYIEGLRLIRKPVEEIEILYDKKDFNWEDKLIIPGINQNIISRVKGESFHFKGSFDLKSTDNCGFLLRMNKKKEGTEIIYSTKNNQLSILGNRTIFEPSNNKIDLEILLDKASIEVFANDGKVSISSCFSPEDGANGTYLFTIGGEILVEKLDIYPVLSILNSEEK